MKSLEIIFNSIIDYRCVFIESNSSDNTLNYMKEWSSMDNRRTILSFGNLIDAPIIILNYIYNYIFNYIWIRIHIY
jgi:hypothetical protein